jgi:hypothetical protein
LIKVVAIRAEQNKLDDVISVNVRDSLKRKAIQQQNVKHEASKKNVRKKWHFKVSLLLKRCFD